MNEKSDTMMETLVEETLDPPDWEALRALGHRMLDEMLTYLATVRERPVWQPVPEGVKEHLKQRLPIKGAGAEQTYEEFRANILPHTMGNIHPRFWGWVIGTGTPFGMLAEMLAAGMNPNVSGGEMGPIYVERQVLDWCKEMFGFPPHASGLLVSGASMANLVALTVARNAKGKSDVLKAGLRATPQPMTLYASSETHSSVQKAVELLGLGSDALRRIPVNENYQIDIAELESVMAQDRAGGFQPFCIVGNAGTVNTGAFDDLQNLAEICARENLWFHVDGAFGALVALSPELRLMVAGLERADSLAFDLHKWMSIPYEAGGVLVRDADEHHQSFASSGIYLSRAKRGLAAGPTWFNEYGMQLSRSFRALKVWMLIKEHGIEKYGRLITQNVAQARYLVSLIEAASPELELLAPAPLNIVCFRFTDQGLDEAQLNHLNEEILGRLQESGVALPSHTKLEGRYALRVAISNHRSRREDFEMLVSKVIELGRHLRNKDEIRRVASCEAMK